MASKAKNAILTIHSGEIKFNFSPVIIYACWQLEKCTKTGKLHTQMFIQMKTQTRIAGVKKAVGADCHVQFQRFGNVESMKDYCMKEDTRVEGPWEFGIFASQGSKKRTAKELYEDDPDSLRLEDPAKYLRCKGSEVESNWRKHHSENEFPHELKPWQNTVIDLLEEPADERTIIWVYGSEGGEGKSVFADHLAAKPGWIYLQGGKRADMAQYLGTNCPEANVVMDIPAASMEHLDYSFLEKIKDRKIWIGKWDSRMMCMLNKVHVIVFSNELPCCPEHCPVQLGDKHKSHSLMGGRIKLVRCNLPPRFCINCQMTGCNCTFI